MLDNQEVIDLLKRSTTQTDLLSGDTWVEIKHEEFEHGIFVQVEINEDDNYSVIGYRNIGFSSEGYMTTDYSDTVLCFETTKEELQNV